MFAYQQEQYQAPSRINRQGSEPPACVGSKKAAVPENSGLHASGSKSAIRLHHPPGGASNFSLG